MPQAASLSREAPEAPAVNPKRAAIVGAATKLFLDAGYADTSMDTIAAVAGVSKRTVYSHFDNKAALFAAVMGDLCQRLVGPCPLGDHWTGAPRDVLPVVGRWFVTLITSPEAIALQRVVVAESVRVPELGEVFMETGPKMIIGRVSQYLAEQHALGALDVEHAEAAAIQFVEIVKAPIFLPLSLGLRPPPEPDEIDRTVGHAVDVFLRAYAPA